MIFSKDQGSKVRDQGSQRRGLLARTNEHETVEAEPKVIRAAIVAAEPQPVVIAFHAEHAEVAGRVADGLHGDDEPLTQRLVPVLETELGADFCGTELESVLETPLADVLEGGAILEAELGHRGANEIELHLGVAHREGGLAENVRSPVADAAAVTEYSTEIVRGLKARAELDGLPGLELG